MKIILLIFIITGGNRMLFFKIMKYISFVLGLYFVFILFPLIGIYILGSSKIISPGGRLSLWDVFFRR